MLPTTAAFGIIACDVLEHEVRRLVPELKLEPLAIRYLPMGLHDHADLLRREIQTQIDQLEEIGCERLIFVFGLCSNSILGLTAKRAEMVFVRAHDCITLFLGSKERYAEIQKQDPGTYWYSPGWIRGKRVPGPHHFESMQAQFAEKFDADDVEYLMEMERAKYAHYKTAAYTDLDGMSNEAAREATRTSAGFLGLEYREYAGDDGLLKRLLKGPWNAHEFLIVPPGASAEFSADERILRCGGCGCHDNRDPA